MASNSFAKQASASGTLAADLETGQVESRQLHDDQVPTLPKVGYRLVAICMSYFRSRMAIFRKFGDLNMLNLLSLQAELMDLHDDYQTVAESDDRLSEMDPASDYPYSFAHLRQSLHEQDNYRIHQWKKLLEIREKLKEYSKYLAQHLPQIANTGIQTQHFYKLSKFKV